ncbi:monovalent cation/H(+) antiporter subunit G [uncultured Corynebacterium sp.]|uniref:monovalent cation/H(+) antiporter subunit G n=1 Tax=uncultured Corynebacterium sp. TaxID=159447 RepID=UPI00260B5961|nr:monovalent cation/H(+) antiporter subunit G [uncultured Corynebacterium sp.]
MILVADIIAIVLILSGMLLCVAASVGLIRFRDTISRMHASSKPQTLGLILTLAGSLLHVAMHAPTHTTTNSDLALLTLIILFALGTSPIVSNRVGHEAFKERLVDEDSLARDDSREPRD